MNRLHIRWMTRRDFPEVLEIERLSFDDPWTEEEFLRELRKREVVGMVAEREGVVIGFFLYALMRGKFALINFAVHPCQQRLGVGTAMISKMLGKLSHRRPRLQVAVNERWLGCQLFLRSMGFKANRVLRGERGHDNEYEMSVGLMEPAESRGGGAA